MKRTEPEPGQESVWDYPRPPRMEDCAREIRVVFAGRTIVQTNEAKRVLETSHPPVYYIPISAIPAGVLSPTDRVTFCEWKGVARYFDVTVNERTAHNAAWGYDRPNAPFRGIRNHVAIYAHLMDACYVDDERVETQSGGFYGGWITEHVTGPFKGGPGTRGW